MLWNFFAAGLLLFLARKYKDKMKPGVIFGGWLILAGVGRNVIEFFRPDQPTFPGTAFSYSRLIAILMAIAGLIIILVKYRVLKLKFMPAGEEQYHFAPPLEERLKGKKEQGAEKTEEGQKEPEAVNEEKEEDLN